MNLLQLLLVLLLIVFVGLIISAVFNRVIFRMGIRNIGRRKGNTIIVIVGLMIGTAIITASFTIGDTMGNMVDSVVVDGMGEVDLIITDVGANPTYLSGDSYRALRQEILAIPHVEGVSGELSDPLPVACIESLQYEPAMYIMGVNATELAAFGGITGDGRPIEFDLGQGEAYLNSRAAIELDIEVGYTLQIFNSSDPPNFVNFTVKAILDNEGYANWNLRANIIVSLEAAQGLFEKTAAINMIKITNEGDEITGAQYSNAVEEAMQPILEDYPGLETLGNKHQVLEDNREQIKQLTDLFFVFGTFTIIAGVILIINIFVMLAEERKMEMGICRAVGMKRKHLKRMFLFEGSAYAAIAGIVGILFGLAIAYLAMWAIKDMFQQGSEFDVLQYYTFRIPNLMISFVAGFLLTIATIMFVTGRISKLNIVRAIRKIPEPLVPRRDTRMAVIGIVLMVASALLLLGGIQNEQAAPTWAGLSLIVYSIGILSRRFMGDRAAFSIFPLIVLILWMQPYELFSGFSGGLEMFILSGLFLVGSTVILIMFNSDTILNALTSFGSRKKAGQAVFKIAVSYPMKSKFRTGMTIMIFGLIIFTIVVLSMIINVFNVNIERMIEEQGGGFDIYAFSYSHIPDIESKIDDNDNLLRTDFEGIYSMSFDLVEVDEDNNSIDSIYYHVIGCDNDFLEENLYSFLKHSDQFDSDREVWEALQTNPEDYIIIDGTVAPQEYGPNFGLITADVGAKIVLENRSGSPQEFEVIGILKETFLQGIFMHYDTANNAFGNENLTLFMFELRDDSRATQIARDLERELFQYGLQPIVLVEIMERMTQQMNMFFNLFSAFLGAGLIIGVSALGIITLRAVHERRLEIGMLRAIGFKRRMITKSFLIEATLIAAWGCIIGTIHGIYIGYYIWRESFKELDYVFSIPWMRIGVVLLITIVFTLICVFPPSYQASKVEPAEALRFE